jgi:pyruvate dehydrogenase E2 component (dihydrolipoamide acetyltransferase)
MTAQAKEIRVPDIGDFKDVAVIEVLVKPGDSVKKEDSLISLESDKATMEVPSPEAGVVRELKVKVGDKVSEGTLLLTVEAEAELAENRPAQPETREASSMAPVAKPAREEPAAPQPVREPTPPAPAAPHRPPPVAPAPTDEVMLSHASPSVRRFARELGVDLGNVRGSGPNGRIVKEDVQAYVKHAFAAPKAAPDAGVGFWLPQMPEVDFSKFGPIETRSLSRIKKLSGANLHRNWVAIPHVTQNDEADITGLEAFRKSLQQDAQRQGVRLTLLAFLVKASVAALKKYPEFNASLNPAADSLILKNYYHIGVAVDIPEGLVVPVIRDADNKGFLELARELGEVSARARDKQLSASDMQGSCFSISSLGGISGTGFTPIINAPEVAILGVSKAVQKPVCRDNQIMARLMLPLSLSYDHRVIDGAGAARFTEYICAVLSDARRLIL